MRPIIVVIAAAAALAAGTSTVHAQSWQPPADSARCPSKWGPGDERGAGNHMKPETVLRAARLIRTGRGVRARAGAVRVDALLRTPAGSTCYTKRTVMNPGSNSRGSNEEIVIAEIGQVGTQFDGFSHQTIGNSMYNCFKLDDTSTRTGFTKLGIENVGALMTRGVADRRRRA